MIWTRKVWLNGYTTRATRYTREIQATLDLARQRAAPGTPHSVTKSEFSKRRRRNGF